MAQTQAVVTNKGVLGAAVANAGTVTLPFRSDNRAKWAAADLTTLRVIVGELGTFSYPSVSVSLGSSMTVTNNTGVTWPKDTAIDLSATQPVISIVRMSQAEYDLLASPDPYTLYATAGLRLGSLETVVASRSQMRILRSLLGKVLGGEGRVKLGMPGDSVIMGRGNGSGTNGEVGARLKSPPSVLARLLQSMGIPSRSDFVAGKVNTGLAGTAGYTQYDPNLVFAGSTWVSAGGIGLPGGYWSAPSGMDAMTFTPEKAADRLDVYYLGSNNTYGTFTVTDVSGTLATVNAGAQANLNVYKASVTRAAASTAAFNIQRSAGGAIGIFALDPWNSTLPEVSVLNLGRDGARTADFIDQSFTTSTKYVLAALQLDYMIAELGLNDKNTGVSLATYLANLQTLLINHVAVSGAGSFALATSMLATAGSGYDMASWLADIRALAATLDVPLIDHAANGISRETLPGDYYDTVHLLARGSAMKGRLLSQFVTS